MSDIVNRPRWRALRRFPSSSVDVSVRNPRQTSTPRPNTSQRTLDSNGSSFAPARQRGLGRPRPFHDGQLAILQVWVKAEGGRADECAHADSTRNFPCLAAQSFTLPYRKIHDGAPLLFNPDQCSVRDRIEQWQQVG